MKWHPGRFVVYQETDYVLIECVSIAGDNLHSLFWRYAGESTLHSCYEYSNGEGEITLGKLVKR